MSGTNGNPLDESNASPSLIELRREAKRIVDLEQAVQWERANRGIARDGIDDWKRRSIILALLIIGFAVTVASLIIASN
jgi:hypothetical protein